MQKSRRLNSAEILHLPRRDSATRTTPMVFKLWVRYCRSKRIPMVGRSYGNQLILAGHTIQWSIVYYYLITYR